MAIVHSNIKRTEIRAPFSGALGLKLVSPGAYVTPATMLTTIRQNTQKLWQQNGVLQKIAVA